MKYFGVDFPSDFSPNIEPRKPREPSKTIPQSDKRELVGTIGDGEKLSEIFEAFKNEDLEKLWIGRNNYCEHWHNDYDEGHVDEGHVSSCFELEVVKFIPQPDKENKKYDKEYTKYLKDVKKYEKDLADWKILKERYNLAEVEYKSVLAKQAEINTEKEIKRLEKQLAKLKKESVK